MPSGKLISHTRIGVTLLIAAGVLLTPASASADGLGENPAIRTYMEFADGKNRGIYDPATDSKGYRDEDYDATTAMVINWHRLPETEPTRNAVVQYRSVHPDESPWVMAEGESFEFWHRDEAINRVILTDLTPGSVYEYRVAADGPVFRFRTMPSSLDERDVKIVFTADHQSPDWNDWAHANARQVAEQKPDMFVVAGDFVNCEGAVTPGNAERWATYLDYLYGVEDGYLLVEKEIDGTRYENIVIPHLSVLGNHETGKQHHVRWPACVNTGRSEPGYPTFVAANWMQLLFHWPYSSEGFYSEFNPDHPNIDPEQVIPGYGKGGYGTLSFADYLLLIGLDNSQNFEGVPDIGLRDWEGNLLTDKWPWYETVHADIRQDEWLRNVLEPENGPRAGDVYSHIIPVWHRGLFGAVRISMSLKNRAIFKDWLPILARNGAKLVIEGHDHIYTRTVPLSITADQPENTYIEKVYYKPNTWPLPEGLEQDYLDDFFAVDALKDNDSHEIVGWTYAGHYTTYDPEGMIAQGHGGWAGGRGRPGGRGGGNAGLWFVDEAKGGASFGGDESFHITTVVLAKDALTVAAHHPHQERPIHKAKWDRTNNTWLAFDFDAPEGGAWVAYEALGK